eukprot:1479995-Prymnesium_polylepis.1
MGFMMNVAIDTSPLYPEAIPSPSALTTLARAAFVNVKPDASATGKGKGKGGGGGRGGGRGALALTVASGAPRSASGAAPAPPQSAGADWKRNVTEQVTALTGAPFKGFQVAGSAHALTFLTLMA